MRTDEYQGIIKIARTLPFERAVIIKAMTFRPVSYSVSQLLLLPSFFLLDMSPAMNAVNKKEQSQQSQQSQ